MVEMWQQGGTRTAEHVQHDGGGVEVGGRARVVAGVLAPRAVDYQVAHLQPGTSNVLKYETRIK